MSTLAKVSAALALIVGAIAATTGPADAGHWRHRHHSGLSFSFGFGSPYPYYAPYYAPPVYYAPRPYCRWTRVRVWRHGHWHSRRVRQCW